MQSISRFASITPKKQPLVQTRHFKPTIGKSKEIKQVSIPFKPFLPIDKWLSSKPLEAWIKQYNTVGYVTIPHIIDPDNLPIYQAMYQDFITNTIDARVHRHDLGSNQPRISKDIENICQIMWPTRYISNLHEGPFHSRAAAISQIILGDDSTFDFDMMLYKAAHVEAITPWHQDIGYWPPMPDKRAGSFWCALDDVHIDNGCLWFQPYGLDRTQIEGKVFNHEPAAPKSHVLAITNDNEWSNEMNEKCDGIGIPVPLSAGSCTIHHGYTPHYAGGNISDHPRRALVACYRPELMVQYERDNGFDHGYHGLNNILLSEEEVIVQN